MSIKWMAMQEEAKKNWYTNADEKATYLFLKNKKMLSQAWMTLEGNAN